MTDGTAALLRHPPLRRVLNLLSRDGEEGRLVGGALRNALLGRPVHEYDVATTAIPDVVTARAAAAGLRTVPTGIAHGTVTLLVEGQPFEVTTLREDVETDGRHAVIRFGRSFAEDAARRDFTINALSLDLDGRIHDYTGGIDDIAARRVRFIGDADRRVREDYLRILRFFRFSAAYAEGPLDAAGLAASIRGRAGLAMLSRERVRQELLKLLAASRAAETVSAVADTGLLAPLLRGLPYPARFARVRSGDDALLGLAALAVAVPEDARRLREALRLSNQETVRLEGAATTLVPLHGRMMPPDDGELRSLLFSAGREAARDALRLALAESCTAPDDPAWAAALHRMEDMPEPRLPFSGADLLARGLRGSSLGEALKQVRAAWIRAGLPSEPATLAALLEAVAPRVPPRP